MQRFRTSACRGAGAKPSDRLHGFHQMVALFTSVDFTVKDRFCLAFTPQFFFHANVSWQTVSTTALPLPLPPSSAWCWGSFSRLSKRKLSKLCRARLLHVLVFTLDFLHLGRFPTCDELSRRHSKSQSKIFHRLRSLIAACGSSSDLFLLAPGRAGPDVGASLLQLENFLKGSREFQGNYLYGPMDFTSDPGLFPAERFPELVYYRSLDASRLRLVGSGYWSMASLLMKQTPQTLAGSHVKNASSWCVCGMLVGF